MKQKHQKKNNNHFKRAREAQAPDSDDSENLTAPDAVRGDSSQNRTSKDRHVYRVNHGVEGSSIPEAFTSITESHIVQQRETLVSMFSKMTVSELEAKKEASKKPIIEVSPETMHVSLEDVYPPDHILDFPKRPEWSYSDTKEILEERETLAFQAWLSGITNKGAAPLLGAHLNEASQRDQLSQDFPGCISYYEKNMNVWRQLWRVLEVSDVLVVVVDARHPLLGFPPTLYRHIVHDLQKPLIVVFQKIDLVPEKILQGWKSYFETTFPGIRVTTFASFTFWKEIMQGTGNETKETRKNKKSTASHLVDLGRRIKYVSYMHVIEILEACQSLLNGRTSLTGQVMVDWDKIIDTTKTTMIRRINRLRQREQRRDAKEEGLGRIAKRQQQQQIKQRNRQNEHIEDNDEDYESESHDSECVETSDDDYDNYSSNRSEIIACEEDDGLPTSPTCLTRKKWITLGMIGYPNVGKSSLINGILGKKVVSVSKTPGHTKHLQTIHITDTLRLCDCPGLVFPSFIPRELQILFGMYNVAQVQEPYTVVAYLAQRIPLPRLLGLIQRGEDENMDRSHTQVWSGWNICEAFAAKKGFFTPRGRPDSYRGANLILRMANEGKLNLVFLPPKQFMNDTVIAKGTDEINPSVTIQSQRVPKNRKKQNKRRVLQPNLRPFEDDLDDDDDSIENVEMGQPLQSRNAFSILNDHAL